MSMRADPTAAALLALLLAGCGAPPRRGDRDGDGWTVAEGDCDDGNAAAHPAAEDGVADGADQDCSGGDTCYEDADGDRFGSTRTFPSVDLDCRDVGESRVSTDCDDWNADVHPGAAEVCDGLDDDCEGGPGADESDGDADGWMVCGGDCDDADPDVNAAGHEACGNAVDDDCDGLVDCEDGDCDVPPCAEDCATPADDDLDGLLNCTDDDCWSAGACALAARVRLGGHAWWHRILDEMGPRGWGTATSVDGTLWLRSLSAGAGSAGTVTCAWHVDHADFYGTFYDVVPCAWGPVDREFSLSSECPLPEHVQDFLPAPVTRRGRVAGCGRGDSDVWVYSWYAGAPVLLSSGIETHHGDVVGSESSWSMAPIEAGSTLEIRMVR